MKNKNKNKNLLNNVESIEKVSIGDNDIRYYLPDVPIIKYSDFQKYSSIDDLLPNAGSMLVYLIEDSPNSGHWCCICKRNNEILCFDPYGNKVDSDLKWTDMKNRRLLGQGESHLSNLLNKCNNVVKYNNIDYQSHKDGINTCGRHCLFFLKSGLGLEDYYNFMKEMKKNNKGFDYDDIVTYFINRCS